MFMRGRWKNERGMEKENTKSADECQKFRHLKTDLRVLYAIYYSSIETVSFNT